MVEIAPHYRLLAAALPAAEKRIRTSYVPSLVLVMAASTVVFVSLGLSKGATAKSIIIYGLVMTAYIACIAIWYPRRMRRRLIRCWETYDLEIGHDYLMRRQEDLPDLRLQFDEVEAIEHVKGEYLRVIGKSKGRVIAIPESIEQFADVLNTISSIGPVRARRIEQWKKYRAFMATALLLFMIMLWATSPVVVIPLSLVMGFTIGWIFFWFRRNASISERAKRIAWTYWIFFAICVLKLVAALEGVDKGSTTVGNIAAYILLFSPALLLVFGWMRWSYAQPRGHWRNYAIAWGLATASLSALCLYGVISYVQLSHIGRSTEHRLAIAGVCVRCPLAVSSLIAAIIGQGRSRVIAWLAGAALALVWSVAFSYA